MTKVIKISESDIINISRIIYESEIDISYYDDDDFIEVFIINFRKWLVKNHGEKTKEYPLSYVINKHLEEFCNTLKDFDYNCSPRHRYSTKYDIIRVGQFLAKSGLEKIGKVPLSFKHTEKYKKMWDAAIKNAKIPNFISYELTEEIPFNIVFKMKYDLEDFLRSTESFNRNYIPNISEKIKNFLQKFGGIKFGRLQFGELEFNSYIDVTNTDLWTDKKFMTNLKKQFKQKPFIAEKVHSLKFYYEGYRNDTRPAIKVSFRQGNWSGRQEVRNEIRDVLRANGFNIDNIKIED